MTFPILLYYKYEMLQRDLLKSQQHHKLIGEVL